MVKVTAFKASDGSLFETPRECDEHEAALIWRGKVDEYLNSDANDYVGPMRGVARRAILGWEMFKAKGGGR
jgi:hypothetical protein